MKSGIRLIIALLLLSPCCMAAVAHVNSAANFSNTGGSVTKAYTCASASNILIIHGSTTVSTDTLSLTSAGLSFTIANPKTSRTGVAAGSWWILCPDTASHSYVFSGSGASGFANITLDEFSGQNSTPIDNHTETNGSGTPTTTITPVVGNCGLWAAADDSITAVGSGFTKGADDTQGDWTEWKILSGGGGSPQTANFSGSGTFALLVLTIAPSGGASPTPGTDKQRKLEQIDPS